MEAGGTLQQVIERLDDPIIYVPLAAHSFHYGHHFSSTVWQNYAPHLIDLEQAP